MSWVRSIPLELEVTLTLPVSWGRLGSISKIFLPWALWSSSWTCCLAMGTKFQPPISFSLLPSNLERWPGQTQERDRKSKKNPNPWGSLDPSKILNLGSWITSCGSTGTSPVILNFSWIVTWRPALKFPKKQWGWGSSRFTEGEREGDRTTWWICPPCLPHV